MRSAAAVSALVLLAGCVAIGSPFGSQDVFVDYVGEYESTKVMLAQTAFLVKQPSTKKGTVIRLQEASQRATDTLERAAKASDIYGAINRDIAQLQASGQPVPEIMLQNARAAKVSMRVWIPRIKADRLYLQGALVGGHVIP